MRSDEQMPGTVTRAPVARVAARLGGGVGTGVGGEHHCRRLIDVERAIDHVETRTSASRVTSREIYPNWIPLPDPACPRLVDTADQLIAAGQAAERQPRSHARNKRNRPGRTRRWSNASQTSQCQPIEGGSATYQEEMRPEGPGRCCRSFGGCPVTRPVDPLILDSAARR